MEFNIHDTIPKKYTDRYLSEGERKRKKKKPKDSTGSKKQSEINLTKHASSSCKSDETKSQGVSTEDAEFNRAANKNIVLDKAEVEQVKNVQIKTKFWFD